MASVFRGPPGNIDVRLGAAFEASLGKFDFRGSPRSIDLHQRHGSRQPVSFDVTGTGLKLCFLFGEFVGALPRLATIHGARFRDKTAETLKVFDKVLRLFAYLVENGPPGRLPFSIVKMNKVEQKIGDAIPVAARQQP